MAKLMHASVSSVARTDLGREQSLENLEELSHGGENLGLGRPCGSIFTETGPREDLALLLKFPLQSLFRIIRITSSHQPRATSHPQEGKVWRKGRPLFTYPNQPLIHWCLCPSHLVSPSLGKDEEGSKRSVARAGICLSKVLS